MSIVLTTIPTQVTRCLRTNSHEVVHVHYHGVYLTNDIENHIQFQLMVNKEKRSVPQQFADEQEIRCLCRNLVAKSVPGGIEIKCRRCKRFMTLPLGAKVPEEDD